MKLQRIQIKKITLIFSENQQNFIDKIKMTIQNNYELIFSYLNQNKTIDISQDKSNFNNMFYNIINEEYNNDDSKEFFSDKDNLSLLYIEALFRKKKYGNTPIIEKNPNISDELLSTLIAYKYFETNGTFDDFVEYLKDRNQEEKLFQWLQKLSRWNTYNYLLNTIANYLKEYDKDFFEQISYITRFWLNRSLNNIHCEDISNKECQKISEKEFDTLFYEFLNYINAPIEWTKTYEYLKKNSIIIKEETEEEDSKSQCFLNNDGILKILITNGNTLKGFRNFIHEFIHYIINQNCSSLPKTILLELPSTFFERIAGEFLEKKGYSNEITNQIIDDRNNNNYSLFTKTKRPLFIDLIKYINHGEIKKDNIYKVKMAQIMQEKQMKNSREIEEKKKKIAELVDKECDTKIDLCISNGFLIIIGYRYLLSTYLTEQILDKKNSDNNDRIIEKMINITNSLESKSVKDIQLLFDIENAKNKKVNVKQIK